jgi:PP-loop superfamily ATP-utilizing enzyme
MPLTIKMCDGTTKEVTPRPTVNVDGEYCAETNKQRAKALRKKIRISHEVTRQVRIYRELQWHIMQTTHLCTKKQAKAWSEDPDPYDKTYVFYCLAA